MMHDIKALHNKVVDFLLQIYKEHEDRTSFEEVILFFFETSLIHYAESYGVINYSGDVTKKRLKFVKENKKILVSSLFEDKEHCNDELYKCIYVFVCGLIDTHLYCIDDIGELFESLINLEYGADDVKESIKRSDAGMYFTDPVLVHNTLKLMLRGISKKEILNRKYIDPAMGAGAFIFGLLDIIRENSSDLQFRNFVIENVYGTDKNPVVVDIFKLSIRIKYCLSKKEIISLSKHFVACDSLLTPLYGKKNSWNNIFPDVFKNGGFDCVIGNPPWGKIKCNVREFYLINSGLTEEFQGDVLKKRIKGDEKKFQEWEAYQSYIKGYSRKLKKSLNFEHQQYVVDGSKTGGDSDLYKYFLELSVKLIKQNGTLAYIIPASFYLSEGATGLRHYLLENGTIEYLFNFENKKHIFAIHPSFKFIVLIYRYNKKPGKIKRAYFDMIDVYKLDYSKISKVESISYSRKFLELCSKDSWAVPECKTANERVILEKLFLKYPPLGKKEKRLWNISFCREFDMTMDSNKFHRSTELKNADHYLPLYEGRMVHQFNSSKKKYVKGTGRTAVWESNTSYDGDIKPQYYISEDDCTSIKKRYRAAYCEITGQKNVRTVLASMIGPDAVCGNKVPVVSFDDDVLDLHLFWVGVANSFIIDWIIRKKISITLNYYHWMTVPFPRITSSDDRFNKIAALAAVALARINQFSFESLVTNQSVIDYMNVYRDYSIEKIRLYIDMIVADLYDVSSDEMIHILYDFKSLDLGVAGVKGDTKYNNDRNSTYVTRDKLIYEMRKKENKSVEISVDDIFREQGIDILDCTGEIKILEDRIQYYKRYNIYAYQD